MKFKALLPAHAQITHLSQTVCACVDFIDSFRHYGNSSNLFLEATVYSAVKPASVVNLFRSVLFSSIFMVSTVTVALPKGDYERYCSGCRIIKGTTLFCRCRKHDFSNLRYGQFMGGYKNNLFNFNQSFSVNSALVIFEQGNMCTFVGIRPSGQLTCQQWAPMTEKAQQALSQMQQAAGGQINKVNVKDLNNQFDAMVKCPKVCGGFSRWSQKFIVATAKSPGACGCN